jgi:hypothetical protein
MVGIWCLTFLEGGAMEKISFMLLSVLAIPLIVGIAESDVVINEVLYDPVGADTQAEEWIELHNNGASQTLNGWSLDPDNAPYYDFPNLTIPSGKFVIVILKDGGGTDDLSFDGDNAAHLYIDNSSQLGNTSGHVDLYNSTTRSSGTMVDYVEWGTGGETHEAWAVSAGIWPANDAVPDVAEGHSIEYDGSGNSSSDWFDQTAPTQGSDNSLPVTLSFFTALPGDGRIVLCWITESEIENLGFNVCRSLKEDGAYTRINGDLIQGAGSSAMRSEYSFTDVRLTNGRTYCYKLEDVSFDGKRMLHGPIQAIPEVGSETEAEASKEEGPKRSQWGTVKHSMRSGDERD